jgi:hypothetical protein
VLVNVQIDEKASFATAFTQVGLPWGQYLVGLGATLGKYSGQQQQQQQQQHHWQRQQQQYGQHQQQWWWLRCGNDRAVACLQS